MTRMRAGVVAQTIANSDSNGDKLCAHGVGSASVGRTDPGTFQLSYVNHAGAANVPPVNTPPSTKLAGGGRRLLH